MWCCVVSRKGGWKPQSITFTVRRAPDVGQRTFAVSDVEAHGRSNAPARISARGICIWSLFVWYMSCQSIRDVRIMLCYASLGYKSRKPVMMLFVSNANVGGICLVGLLTKRLQTDYRCSELAQQQQQIFLCTDCALKTLCDARHSKTGQDYMVMIVWLSLSLLLYFLRATRIMCVAAKQITQTHKLTHAHITHTHKKKSHSQTFTHAVVARLPLDAGTAQHTHTKKALPTLIYNRAHVARKSTAQLCLRLRCPSCSPS